MFLWWAGLHFLSYNTHTNTWSMPLYIGHDFKALVHSYKIIKWEKIWDRVRSSYRNGGNTAMVIIIFIFINNAFIVFESCLICMQVSEKVHKVLWGSLGICAHQTPFLLQLWRSLVSPSFHSAIFLFCCSMVCFQNSLFCCLCMQSDGPDSLAS